MVDISTYLIYVSLLLISVSLLIINLYVYKGRDCDLFLQPNRLKLNHLFALLLISFIVGFRYNVGVDWEGYKQNFEFMKSASSVTFEYQKMEWGFFTINKIIAAIGGNYTIMFFTVAFISWYFIFKSVPAILLPLVIYFLFTDEYFFWSMNGVRQFVAIGLFMYALHFIIEKNIKMYLLIIVVAALFHTSVLFMIPIYFIPFQKIYNQKFWLIAFLISFFFANTFFLVNGLQKIYTNISDKMPFLSIYSRYFENGKYIAQELSIGLGYIFRQLVTILILVFSKSVIKAYPQTKIYFVLYFSGAIFFNMFYMFQLIDRLNIYFLILRPIVLAILVFHLWKTRKYRIVSITLLALYFYLYLTTIYNSSNMCSPYDFSF